MAKCIECRRSTGTFKKEDGSILEYDNYVFTTEKGQLYQHEQQIFGEKLKEIKIPVKNFKQFYQGDVTELKNKDVLFLFDENRRLLAIQVK